MATVGLVVVLAVAATQPDTNLSVQRARLEEVLDISGTTAAEDYARRGQRAVTTYFNRLRRSERRKRDGNLKLWFFDDKGIEINRQEVPKRVRASIKHLRLTGIPRAGAEPEIQWATINESVIGARWTTDGRGNFYLIAAELNSGLPRDAWARIERVLRAPWPTQLVRGMVVFITTGLICFFLARHLTAPITQLQSTARRLASGEFEARMGPALGARKDELAVLARDFDRMADQLQSLLLSQTRLLGDISHELRSPLARLNVAHDLALHHAATGKLDELGEDLQRINSETLRLDALIEQLLTLSLLESGTEHHKNEVVKLSDLLHEIANDADFEAQSINKKIQIARSDECLLSGDKELLRSAIENVVRNALRYTADNSSVLLTLLCQPDQPTAVITVRDHGPGVPTEELANLFRPFYRIAEARDRQSGGAGLGLAIAERAVHAHGGSVSARNAQGGGLEIEICLPLSPTL